MKGHATAVFPIVYKPQWTQLVYINNLIIELVLLLYIRMFASAYRYYSYISYIRI